MKPEVTTLILIIAVALVLILNFIKKPALLKNRQYLFWGILSNLLFITFMLLFIIEAPRGLIYFSLAAAFLPGLYFQYLKSSLQKRINLMDLVAAVLALISVAYIIYKPF